MPARYRSAGSAPASHRPTGGTSSQPGQPVVPLAARPARRRPRRALALTGAAVLALTLPALAAVGSPEVAGGRAFVSALNLGLSGERGDVPADVPPAGGARAGPPGAEAADRATPVTAPFARVGAATLRLPAVAPVVVGFHEASSRHTLELEPVGTVVDHQNRTKFDPPDDDAVGPDYLVMASRGRPFPATSAVDVVMVDGDPVVSPVTGVVTDVRSYALYGEHPDHRVEIAPADAPETLVVMIHVEDVRVEVGDRVAAGRSVVAGSARRFPFSSQIDRYTEPDRWPHVHLEAKPVSAPRPGDDG